jgi:hypothetical protein
MSLTLADIEHRDSEDYFGNLAYTRYLATSPEAAGLPGFLGPTG